MELELFLNDGTTVDLQLDVDYDRHDDIFNYTINRMTTWQGVKKVVFEPNQDQEKELDTLILNELEFIYKDW